MLLTFVCSGNTCRSPLAVAAWQVAAREMDERCRARLARVTVGSAGLNARAGTPATAMAQGVAAGWDADLSEHRARVWRPESEAGAGVIVTMTQEQSAQVRFRLQTQNATASRGQDAPAVETLGVFIAGDARAAPPPWSDGADELALDIPDPYGGSREAYEECAARILRAVRALARSYCRE